MVHHYISSSSQITFLISAIVLQKSENNLLSFNHSITNQFLGAYDILDSVLAPMDVEIKGISSSCL